MSEQKRIAQLAKCVDWTLPTAFIAELLFISYGTAFSMRIARSSNNVSRQGRCQFCGNRVPNNGVACIECLQIKREANRKKVAGTEEKRVKATLKIKLPGEYQKRYESLKQAKDQIRLGK